jgi:hypothetical protein
MSHLSGTKTAFSIKLQNYRDKLMGSVTKHLDTTIEQQTHNDEDKYASIKPKT